MKHEILFRWNKDCEKFMKNNAPNAVFIYESIVQINGIQYIKIEWIEQPKMRKEIPASVFKLSTSERHINVLPC